MTRIRTCVIGICTVALLLTAMVVPADTKPASKPATRPAVKPARDTTFFTKPLLPDGSVDYIAAINEHQSKGVTPENNAAVLLVQAFGPEMFDEARREQTLRMMGVKLSKNAKYLTKDWKLIDSLMPLMEGPWKANEHPEVAAGLKDNKDALDLVVTSSKRTRFYIPLVRGKSDDHMLNILMYNVVGYKQAGQMLVARANLAIGEGRAANAREDMLASRRLGLLLTQDSTLLSALVGIATAGVPNPAIQHWATSGDLGAKEARLLIHELAALPPGPNLVNCWDVGERCFLLDIIQQLNQMPDNDVPGFFDIFGATKADEKYIKKGLALRKKMDPAQIFRLCNSLFDQLVAATKTEDQAKGGKAWQDFNKRIEALKLQAQNMPPDDCDARTATQWVGAALMSEFFPRFLLARVLPMRAKANNDLTLLAVGIAAYKAEKGQYPTKLADLKGAYLKTIPVDVFSGKDYVYKPGAKGYLLYSVGDNGADDGGKDRKAGGDDIVVRAGSL